MFEFVLLYKPYHHLIFKPKGILRKDLVSDFVFRNKMGPDEVNDFFCPNVSQRNILDPF